MLLFELSRPARIRVTVYGPGPSCGRLGAFGRPGRVGPNRIPLSGSLYGRPLPPGRYAIVVEAIQGMRTVRIGRVLVTILPRDGREGGNRPLLAPDCNGGSAVVFLASEGGDFGGVGPAGSGAGGVAGVRAARGDTGDDLPLLPELPALPAIPSIRVGDPSELPPWAFAALAVLGMLGAAAVLTIAIHRRRESSWAGWE